MQPHDVSDEQKETNENLYIVYRLGEELFASPLLTIREVLRFREISQVPHMQENFLGIINLRGQIVGVMDLRKYLGIEKSVVKGGLIIIIETTEGLLGAVVDELESVKVIDPSQIEVHPNFKTKVPSPHFKGVAKCGDRLFNMVDVAGCVLAADLRIYKRDA